MGKDECDDCMVSTDYDFHWVVRFLEQFRDAITLQHYENNAGCSGQFPSTGRWQPPGKGLWKLNTDATVSISEER